VHPLADRPFLKMNGIGNEIVVLDLRGTDLAVRPEDARAIARNHASHFDQLMVLHDPQSQDTKAFMRIFNADGSQSGACGNGTRCVAWVLLDGTTDEAVVLETEAERLPCRRESEWTFTVDMGAPRFGWDEIPIAHAVDDTALIELTVSPATDPILHSPSLVNMGNPHAIFFVEAIEPIDLATIGPALEHDPLFPERANISLAHVTARDAMTLKVWERGAGLTRACGSAACAAAVAGSRRGLTGRAVRVSLPGGYLMIQWRSEDDHVLMTGAVELEHEGRFDAAIFEARD
jgi:diaminopimelate epimerase